MPAALPFVALLAGPVISSLLAPKAPKAPSPAPIPPAPQAAPLPIAPPAPIAAPTISPADAQGAVKDTETQRQRIAAQAFQTPNVLGANTDNSSVNIKQLLGE